MRTLDASLPSVLVVDDEPLLRSFVRAALMNRAWVLEAGDGELAIHILERQARDSIDLLLLDHRLPKRSGLEVLRVTRQRWPWIPVVILTGVGSEDLAVEALRAGASDYLKKPVSLDVLLQTVTTLTSPNAPRRAAGARAGPGPDTPGGLHPNIDRALVFIRQHFTEPITLSDVAREAALSRFHFSRLFHQELSVTFHDYLHDLRVSRAKIMLANRQLRVSDVAYGVGFNDLSHFDRTFRKLVGQSPTEYRASLRCA
jgi:YesN/AraC family two-component response regulator